MPKVTQSSLLTALLTRAKKSKPKGRFGPNRDLSKCGRPTDKEVMS